MVAASCPAGKTSGREIRFTSTVTSTSLSLLSFTSRLRPRHLPIYIMLLTLFFPPSSPLSLSTQHSQHSRSRNTPKHIQSHFTLYTSRPKHYHHNLNHHSPNQSHTMCFQYIGPPPDDAQTIADCKAQAAKAAAEAAKARGPPPDAFKVASAPLPVQVRRSIYLPAITTTAAAASSTSRSPVSAGSSASSSASSSTLPATPSSTAPKPVSPTSTTSPSPTHRRNPFAHPFTALPATEDRAFTSEARKAADAQFRKWQTGGMRTVPFLSGASGGMAGLVSGEAKKVRDQAWGGGFVELA